MLLHDTVGTLKIQHAYETLYHQIELELGYSKPVSKASEDSVLGFYCPSKFIWLVGIERHRNTSQYGKLVYYWYQYRQNPHSHIPHPAPGTSFFLAASQADWHAYLRD